MRAPRDIPKLPQRKKMFLSGQNDYSSDRGLSTTDATPTTAITVPLAPQTWYYFIGKISAYENTVYNEVYSAEFKFSIYLADAVTTGPVLMNSSTISTYDPNTVPWTYSIDLSTPPDPDAVTITVTGEMDHQISWQVRLDLVAQNLG